MNIDKDRIAAYVVEIKGSLETLKGYSKLEKEVFLSSAVTVRDTKYSFIIAGQAAIDICYHVTAKLLKKAPVDYGNCFELLAGHDAFDKEALGKMARMARFRNLLVHHYIKVDNERVYEELNNIDCFEEFLKSLDILTSE